MPASLTLHIASGLALRLHRNRQQRQRYGGYAPASVSTWRWRNFSGVARAGWVAAPAVVVHAALMRLVPLLVDGDSSQVGLEYLAYGFWTGEWGRVVGSVFYAGFVGVVSYHVVYGWMFHYLKVSERRRKYVLGAAVGTAAVWLSGLTRVVVESGMAGGYMARHYEKLYRVFFNRLI